MLRFRLFAEAGGKMRFLNRFTDHTKVDIYEVPIGIVTKCIYRYLPD